MSYLLGNSNIVFKNLQTVSLVADFFEEKQCYQTTHQIKEEFKYFENPNKTSETSLIEISLEEKIKVAISAMKLCCKNTLFLNWANDYLNNKNPIRPDFEKEMFEPHETNKEHNLESIWSLLEAIYGQEDKKSFYASCSIWKSLNSDKPIDLAQFFKVEWTKLKN